MEAYWREMGTDALALANLAESDIISTLSKVAPVITVYVLVVAPLFARNAVRRRHYDLYNANNQFVFSHASWK